MKPHFLFSSSPMDQKMIDPEFQDQAIALKQAGFGTSVISFENGKIYGPRPDKDSTCVYRGWMLNVDEYQQYEMMLTTGDLTPLTRLGEYMTAHQLPGWYPGIKGITPETEIVTGEMLPERAEAILALYKWEKFQVKDFVKSLKTAGGSIGTDPKQVKTIVEEMEKYRGAIEGGLCLRKWEDYYPGSEKRYFVINRKFFGQDVSFDTRAMSILARLAREIDSPFFSVDIAERVDGHFRVVEIGDGQVSDLIGWTDQRFAEIWK